MWSYGDLLGGTGVSKKPTEGHLFELFLRIFCMIIFYQNKKDTKIGYKTKWTYVTAYS